jgi:type 1 fimbriae regulatory protein FimB
MMNTPKRGTLAGGTATENTSTSREVERLIEATKGSRHGLRVSEACGMKLDQVDAESRVLHVARLKGGLWTTQPLRGDELRAVSAWLKERARMKPICSSLNPGAL